MAPPQKNFRSDRRRKRPSPGLLREDLEGRLMPATIAAPPILPAATVQSMTISPVGAITPDGGNGSPIGYTPQQIRPAYGFNQIAFGTIAGDGAGQTIAIVDAYDDPGLVNSTAANFSTSDLPQFDRQFGLPDPPSFTKIEPGREHNRPARHRSRRAGESERQLGIGGGDGRGMGPRHGPGREHRPGRGQLERRADLYAGINTADHLPGVSVVSMSWGSAEYSGRDRLGPRLPDPGGHQGVTFVAAAGDGGAGPLSGLFAERAWPSAAPR